MEYKAIYRCFCGNEFTTHTQFVKRGTTKSCGCYKKHRIQETCRTHGRLPIRLFRIWSGLKNRVLNANDEAYKDYGGRGITICEKWRSDFINFRDWALENGYSENLTIDRIDVNGNYEPSNCRFATKQTQALNQRFKPKQFGKYKGVTPHFNKWRARIGYNYIRYIIGCFYLEEDVAYVYNECSLIIHRGESPINILPENYIPSEYIKAIVKNKIKELLEKINDSETIQNSLTLM